MFWSFFFLSCLGVIGLTVAGQVSKHDTPLSMRIVFWACVLNVISKLSLPGYPQDTHVIVL